MPRTGRDNRCGAPVRAPTDVAGNASAPIETRNQPGGSWIVVDAPDVSTTSGGTVTWLPAHYESSFLLTCYVVSLESDFTSSPLEGPVDGLPEDKTYHSACAIDGVTAAVDFSVVPRKATITI